MRRIAMQLIKTRQAQPELLRCLEGLEMRVEYQKRELNRLRWTLSGE